MIKLRDRLPVRSFTRQYSSYRSYKPYLSEDFNNRCGYCDDFDGWVGGERTYHIDHFAPKSKFSSLENEYSNLVYACPFCNRFKSNDWPSDDHTVSFIDNKGYIDPCDERYEAHFYRDTYGNIRPNNELAEYMRKKLQLFLSRHRIIWNLTRIKIELDRIKPLLDKHKHDDEKFNRIKDIYFQLSMEFQDYLNYLLGEKLKNG
ncbi:HNH endonuclease [Paenibacillus sp. 1011MAR3C5]|uniref:HNH endonuclease n=1 Tax=Paenibacillus sp. 1011MAR3C5 TaxID=1675787 RepID=UPI001600A26C|nr:HNH endonuclease [Paenibacillus sp. 1011MAR3C5]